MTATIIDFRTRKPLHGDPPRCGAPEAPPRVCNDSRERPPLTPAEHGIAMELVSTYKLRPARARRVAEGLCKVGMLEAFGRMVARTPVPAHLIRGMLRRHGVWR